MKKLLLLIAMILLVAIGCLSGPASPNQPPTAYIDSVSPTNVALGETVTFTGHGIDPDGTVGAYNWRSSRDGDLSTAASFETSSLSPGTHTIWFKVQDDDGVWSNEVLATVIVVPTGAAKPVINSFNASPGSIGSGGSATLSWDVPNAATVSIDQQIGNVSLSGNRVVFPTKTTTYTLTATNAVGTVMATAQIVVSSVSVPTMELYPIAAESGYVRQDGEVGPDIIVGATSWLVAIQAFLSYDISMIPKDAIIESVSLDLTVGNVFGSPFSTMGQLYICNQTYGSLNANDYVAGPPTLAMYSASSMPAGPASSSAMVAAVQEQVDNGNSRFQIRLQFQNAPFQSSFPQQWSNAWKTNPTNDIEFPQAKPKLLIQYE
ncbi:MAG: hypothetical protein WCD72_09210 [Dehalococcoidia bacterium]